MSSAMNKLISKFQSLSTKTFGVAAVATFAFMPLLQCGGGGPTGTITSEFRLMPWVGNTTQCKGKQTTGNHLESYWVVPCTSSNGSTWTKYQCVKATISKSPTAGSYGC